MTPAKIVACILGVVLVIGGIYCLVTPAQTYMALGWLIGAFMLIEGIGSAITWFDRHKAGRTDFITLIGAIISIILGCITLGSMGLQYAFDLFIAYMAALWMVINGVIRAASSLALRGV